MTKLSNEAELALRQLDDEDDATDHCADRHPYQRVATWVLEELQDLAGAKALAKVSLGPERLAPTKRKRGQRLHKPDPLAFAVDDVRRLEGAVAAAVAEMVAVERCRRALPHDGLWGQWCTIDRYGDPEAGWDEDLDELAEKLHKRLHR